jgi:thiamine-phosphate pyrophosphorylase
MRPRPDLSLYLITDPRLCAQLGLVETVLAAVAGGATLVQLRDKDASDEAFVAMGRQLKSALGQAGVPLIVNDRLDAVAAIGADGLHVGQSDMPAREARARLGPDRWLGLSIEAPDQVATVDPVLVDYVGAGPVFATGTKADHAPPMGIDGLSVVASKSPVPTVAIGGLDIAAVASVLAAGAVGLAIVSAICAAPDPREAAHQFRLAIDRARS